ncbi:amino acid permease [Pseudomonas chlororaphis subsp. aurantiaca]|uniref:amino acid permease n=1 Tax=Pseudomonas chlororaphis TaxID=587753 RepID=UPI0027DD310C|nr:amino acid permease [Pseudomonas chlororaphis]WMI97984.1 amino acid permease [Pseudomonas chlororaphis subsp. aurantiaca]
MSAVAGITERESGLKRLLSKPQLTMIAIGSAIGTGLFLGSGTAIGMAGPSVILSYAISALVAFILMACLSEMVVAHPVTGSFGAYAEVYLGGLAGFLVRYAYWISVVLVIGTEVTAIAVYMQYWAPGSPAWLWIAIFSSAIIYLNTQTVKVFGSFEYWLAFFKVAAIAAFIVIGSYVVFKRPAGSDIGFHHYVEGAGFFPNGFFGTWSAAIIALFSFIGIEFIAVAAGEADNPGAAAKSAFKSALFRLVFFYLFTVALMVAIVPWQMANESESPFVLVMKLIGIPSSAGIMNFVILTAALSAMNAQLYVASRMIFSLSRTGYAPKMLGKVSAKGIPLHSLFFSTFGVAAAGLCSVLLNQGTFILMMSIAMFGALFTWLMIFITHYRFRRHYQRNNLTLSFRVRGFPFTTLLGGGLMAALLGTTLLVPQFRMTLVTGIPLLIVLCIAYRFLHLRLPTVAMLEDR